MYDHDNTFLQRPVSLGLVLRPWHSFTLFHLTSPHSPHLILLHLILASLFACSYLCTTLRFRFSACLLSILLSLLLLEFLRHFRLTWAALPYSLASLVCFVLPPSHIVLGPFLVVLFRLPIAFYCSLLLRSYAWHWRCLVCCTFNSSSFFCGAVSRTSSFSRS